MKEFLYWLYEIKTDKYLHFICGLVIYEILFAISIHFFPLFVSIIGAFTLTTLIGAAKEWIYDKKHGVPNVKDFIATEIGALLGVLLMII